MSLPNALNYQRSMDFLRRAEEVIPLGSQTFSKSRTQLPIGAAPLFGTKGDGAHIIDLDGHRYIDYVCSLGAITLGHGDEDVHAAVRSQLDAGILLSLPMPLETEVAERIVAAIPTAEMVRFGKNGSDATAGAIRLARAFTRRDRVAVCGYHGWQDWYIGTTSRNLGVPQATRALTTTFRYGDLDHLKSVLDEHPGEFAAIIMEPVAFDEPPEGYLPAIVELAHAHGALVIFDEVVTGFRFSPGSAQAAYGVSPDLTAIGKGLANGFPLSAVTGRREIMRLMEDVFFSFTMGGEGLSLAAAGAVLDKIAREPVLDTIADVGTRLKSGTAARIQSAGLGDVLQIKGHPSWTLFVFKDAPGVPALNLKTLFIQECCRRGVLNIGLHFVSYSHTAGEIDATLAVYDEVFEVLRQAIKRGSTDGLLDCDPLVPLFRVRS